MHFIFRSYILDTLKQLQVASVQKNEFDEGYFFGRLSVISHLTSSSTDRKLAEKFGKMYRLEFAKFINFDFSKFY